MNDQEILDDGRTSEIELEYTPTHKTVVIEGNVTRDIWSMWCNGDYHPSVLPAVIGRLHEWAAITQDQIDDRFNRARSNGILSEAEIKTQTAHLYAVARRVQAWLDDSRPVLMMAKTSAGELITLDEFRRRYRGDK